MPGMRRPFLTSIGVAAFSLAALTACGGDDEPTTQSSTEVTVSTTNEAGEPAGDTTDESTAPSEPTAAPPDLAPPTTDVFVTSTTRPEPKNTPVNTPATETVYEVGSIDRGLTPFIDEATEHLADRLAVDPGEIEVLTAVLVTWPSAALGCPEPGRSYAQVATDGSVIELGSDGFVYRYHTGGSSGPVACDRPLDPAPVAL